MTCSTWKKTAYAAFALKRAIIAPRMGIGKQSFYLNEQTIFDSPDQLEKRRPTRPGIEHDPPVFS
jgi:hypothetical protein